MENLLNEAALLAARMDRKTISEEDVDEAQDRVVAGPAKPGRQSGSDELRMTAFHEAGHTVCGLVLSDARVVHKVTLCRVDVRRVTLLCFQKKIKPN